MAVTAVFLDLYQTLAYFHPPREERQRLALAEFGFQVDEVTLHRAYLAADHFYTVACLERSPNLMALEERHRIYTRYQEVLMEEAGLAQHTHLGERVYQRYWEMERAFRLFPDVEPALDQLSAEGYRLGLITNVTGDPSDDLERVGLKGRFDAIVASCRVGVEKPHPLIFQTALEALGVRPEEAVHVGDQFLADVEGATGVGLGAVLLDRFDLQEGRHPWRVRSLVELAPLLRDGLS